MTYFEFFLNLFTEDTVIVIQHENKKIFSSLREIIKFTEKWKDYKRTKKFMKKYMKNENWCYATILNGFKLWHVDSDLYQVRECVNCKENPIYVFLFWELRSLSSYFHNHVSVSDLYIPRISPHISLQQNRQTEPGNI
jgi:hypothetical protein